MVGRYGEVVLMDWGVAKSKRDGAALPLGGSPELAQKSGELQPAFATQAGTVVGTPAYMSPEQAQGNLDAIDARSDIYSATVVLHELLAVRHYLFDRQSLKSVMFAVMGDTFSYSKLLFIHHPRFPPPPAHLLHLIGKGLSKDPAQRFQSVEEMISELHRAREGRCRVSCPNTLARRLIGGLGRFVDTHPTLSPILFYATLLWMIFCVVMTMRSLFA
jgi:eukaryotic-like serine/threonine-protein kinase